MGFRDDREALRQRVDVLERDLRRAEEQASRDRRELSRHEAKDVEDERQLSALREEVSRLRARLGDGPARPAKNPVAALVAAIAMVVVVAVGGVLFTVLERGSPPPPPPLQPPSPGWSPPETPGAPSEAPQAPPPVPVSWLDTVVFGGIVTEASGETSVVAGEGCVVVASLRAGPELRRTLVSCGDELVYDSTMAVGMGMSLYEADVTELPGGAPGTLVYQLALQDTGQRTGPRPQLVVDSQARAARVYREGATPFRLVLRLEDTSSPRPGPPLGVGVGTAPFARSLSFRARPTGRTGPAPPAVANARDCALRVRPHSSNGFNCRFDFECEGQTVYAGAGGAYAECQVAAGEPVAARDTYGTEEDADEGFDFDRAAGSAGLWDLAGGERWDAGFALEEPPADALDGRWEGGAIDAEGSAWTFTLAVDGDAAEIDWRGQSSGTERASLEADPLHGTLRMATVSVTGGLAEGTYEGWIGPRARTLSGRWEGPQAVPGVFWASRGPAPAGAPRRP